jgi:uncharacterized protein (TIGR01777 family)
MSGLRVTVTGATGLIGPRLVRALQARGDEVTVLTREEGRARSALGDVQAMRWDLMSEPAPADALAGRDAVVHLAGANVAQRWSENAKQEIRESRVTGTGNLIEGLRAAGPTPAALICSSAIGYYGAHGEEPLDEDAAAGRDFLAQVCVEWEQQALRARELGMRSVQVRTGVVLDGSGGALGKMLTPFRIGVGGPVAGGRQFISWIHADDVVGIMLAAIDDQRWDGPVNATAPEPLSNRDFSRILGRVLHRPAVLPVPGFALQLLYGEMAEIVTTGARVMPAKALVLGYKFAQPQLEPALASAIG